MLSFKILDAFAANMQAGKIAGVSFAAGGIQKKLYDIFYAVFCANFVR